MDRGWSFFFIKFPPPFFFLCFYTTSSIQLSAISLFLMQVSMDIYVLWEKV